MEIEFRYLNIDSKNTNDSKLHIGEDEPIYPLDEDQPENYYANIYNYLLKRKSNQNYSNYPTYIYILIIILKLKKDLSENRLY